jgi:hypothetical protein
MFSRCYVWAFISDFSSPKHEKWYIKLIWLSANLSENKTLCTHTNYRECNSNAARSSVCIVTNRFTYIQNLYNQCLSPLMLSVRIRIRASLKFVSDFQGLTLTFLQTCPIGLVVPTFSCPKAVNTGQKCSNCSMVGLVLWSLTLL